MDNKKKVAILAGVMAAIMVLSTLLGLFAGAMGDNSHAGHDHDEKTTYVFQDAFL